VTIITVLIFLLKEKGSCESHVDVASRQFQANRAASNLPPYASHSSRAGFHPQLAPSHHQRELNSNAHTTKPCSTPNISLPSRAQAGNPDLGDVGLPQTTNHRSYHVGQQISFSNEYNTCLLRLSCEKVLLHVGELREVCISRLVTIWGLKSKQGELRGLRATDERYA